MNMNLQSTNNLNTQHNADVISAIAKENTNSAKSNISSVYDAKSMNIDAAVLSISGRGSARISAMMSKSIQLRASASNAGLSAAERQEVNNELKELRREIGQLQINESGETASVARPERKTSVDIDTDTATETKTEDAEQMIAERTSNILKNAEESIQVQNMNRESVLQLL